MGIVSVKEVQPGMNHQGQLLLPDATLLTEKHIKLLKTWGVVEVVIEGVEAKKKDNIETLDEKGRLAIEAELHDRFPYRELDPINTELKRISANVLVKSYLSRRKA